MAELGHNYNIQVMLLLHELRTSFQNIPDEVVRMCMKKHCNQKERCIEELRIQSDNIYQSRYKARQRLKFSQRRYSAGTLAEVPGRPAVADLCRKMKIRRNSVCESVEKKTSCSAVLAALDQNKVIDQRTDSISPSKRFCDSSLSSLPRKIMRCSEENHPSTHRCSEENHPSTHRCSEENHPSTHRCSEEDHPSTRRCSEENHPSTHPPSPSYSHPFLLNTTGESIRVPQNRVCQNTSRDNVGNSERDSNKFGCIDLGNQIYGNIDLNISKNIDLNISENSDVGIKVPKHRDLGVNISKHKDLGVNISKHKDIGVNISKHKDLGVNISEDGGRKIDIYPDILRSIIRNNHKTQNLEKNYESELFITKNISLLETKIPHLNTLTEEIKEEGIVSPGWQNVISSISDNSILIPEHSDKIISYRAVAPLACDKQYTTNTMKDDLLKQRLDENENHIVEKHDGEVVRRPGDTRLKRQAPRPLALNHTSELDLIPTVVLTPDSPPKDSAETKRQVETLYSPNYPIENQDETGGPCEPTDALGFPDSLVICGENTVVTKTCVDVIPGLGSITLPFGNCSQDVEGARRVTQSSLSTGTLHFMKEKEDGRISLATTNYCGFYQMTVTSSETARPSLTSTTVLYTVNSRPVTCENPFRKVFARRKEFYQARDRPASPETSSKKLLWRPCNHACRRNSACPDRDPPPPAPPPPLTAPRYFTLSANIQPFDAFSIRHNLNPSDCGGEDASASVNLTVRPDGLEPVQLLPDGQGIMYQSRVEIPEEGAQAHLEVKVQRDGSTITTRRTGSSDCTSNEISVQLLDGGTRVNIQQSQVCMPVSPPEQTYIRPTSLNIPAPKYATARPQSLYQGRGTSPLSVPRYNSLPNLKGPGGEGLSVGSWGYQSHPRDEEKRIAYTRALLSQQMEQLLKLESSLRVEKVEVVQLEEQVWGLEIQWNRKSIRTHPQAVEAQVKVLERDITSLRGECDIMSEKVTNLTGGKVPLGETSINFTDYLNTEPSVPDPTPEGRDIPDDGNARGRGTSPPAGRWVSPPAGEEGERWSCSQCTFSNHPSLDTCEICNMPRINIGYPCHGES